MLKALGTNVVVQPIEPAETSPGGIVLVNQGKSSTGTVLSIGNKVFNDFEVGNVVLYKTYAGLTYDNVLVLDEKDIVATVS